MTRVISGAVFDAEKAAAKLRADAEALADEIRASAERDALEIRAAAAREGRDQGMAEAAAALLRARLDMDRWQTELRDEVFALAGEMAERILERALALDPGVCVEICSAALRDLRPARRIVIRAHPEDVKILEAATERLVAESGGAVLTVIADGGMRPGGCVVQGDAVDVDAGISAQVAALVKAIRIGG